MDCCDKKEKHSLNSLFTNDSVDFTKNNIREDFLDTWIDFDFVMKMTQIRVRQ